MCPVESGAEGCDIAVWDRGVVTAGLPRIRAARRGARPGPLPALVGQAACTQYKANAVPDCPENGYRME